jgi:hypothetical protein
MTQSHAPNNLDSLDVRLDLYKLHVEMTDRATARRAEMSKFYISLLTALLAIVSIVIDKGIFASVQSIVFLTVALLGMFLCVTWILNIRSYKRLNSIKFEIIQEMEKNLPFAFYTREWEIVNKGRTDKRYFRLTDLEQIVPLILGVPYLALFVYALTH